ncbi:unnamed protein product [Boreogadus saida]
MSQSREVLSQNSCYTYVMEDEETARAGVNVFELSERGDLGALERLVQRSPALLEERDEGGAGPLHHAAGGGHVSLIQFITSLLPPEELSGRDGQGGTPLHWAVARDQAASCRALMDLRAEPNILNAALMSPLHLAISHAHTPLVELLVSYTNTDCNLKGDLGNTPVMLACSINNWEALSILLQSGGRLCSQNKLGHFAIHAAAFAGATRSMETGPRASLYVPYQTGPGASLWGVPYQTGPGASLWGVPYQTGLGASLCVPYQTGPGASLWGVPYQTGPGASLYVPYQTGPGASLWVP